MPCSATHPTLFKMVKRSVALMRSVTGYKQKVDKKIGHRDPKQNINHWRLYERFTPHQQGVEQHDNVHRSPAPPTSATHQRHSMLRSVGALQTVRTNTQRSFKRARENGQTTRGFSAKYFSISFKLFIQVHFLLFPAHQTYSTGWIASKYRQPWTAQTTDKMTHPDQLSPLYLLIPPQPLTTEEMFSLGWSCLKISAFTT